MKHLKQANHRWEYRIIAKPYNKGSAIHKYHSCGLELDLEWMCLDCGLTVRHTMRGPPTNLIPMAVMDKAIEDPDWEGCN